jgi:hypothetical protein
VYAWFRSHNSPVWGPPRQGRPSITDGTHFEPLISCPLAVQPCLVGLWSRRTRAKNPSYYAGTTPRVAGSALARPAIQELRASIKPQKLIPSRNTAILASAWYGFLSCVGGTSCLP